MIKLDPGNIDSDIQISYPCYHTKTAGKTAKEGENNE